MWFECHLWYWEESKYQQINDQLYFTQTDPRSLLSPVCSYYSPRLYWCDGYYVTFALIFCDKFIGSFLEIKFCVERSRHAPGTTAIDIHSITNVALFLHPTMSTSVVRFGKCRSISCMIRPWDTCIQMKGQSSLLPVIWWPFYLLCYRVSAIVITGLQ